MLVGLIFLLLLKMQYLVVDRRILITGLLLQLISFGGVTDKTFVVLCLNLSNLGLIPNRNTQKKKRADGAKLLSAGFRPVHPGIIVHAEDYCCRCHPCHQTNSIRLIKTHCANREYLFFFISLYDSSVH